MKNNLSKKKERKKRRRNRQKVGKIISIFKISIPFAKLFHLKVSKKWLQEIKKGCTS